MLYVSFNKTQWPPRRKWYRRMVGRPTPFLAIHVPPGWSTTAHPATAGCKGTTLATELHPGVHQIQDIPEHRSLVPTDSLSNKNARAEVRRDPIY